MRSSTSLRGFTLIEMITVIAITGIIAGMVAIFLVMPVKQYTDVGRRAEMTDVADTALRRITRDVRLALPNSVRVTGSCNGSSACTLEFIPIKAGGRYRIGAGGSGDELDFTTADGSFEVLGPMPAIVAGTDQIVVYNLGVPEADAYAGNTAATHNRRAVSAVGANSVTIVSASALPFDSPGHRFHVVTTPVSYICTPNPANPVLGTLVRRSGYGWPEAPATEVNHLIAKNVSACRFSYDANVVAQRSGLVTMTLGITDQGEAAALYSAVHVNNQP